ncbi:hypothetical protein JCM8097_007018 [Rhodosporidiobolus ruineniae]
MSFSTWPGYLAGHRWHREVPTTADSSPPRRPRWTRSLGLLEAKFDQATQRHGQSDTFVRLDVSLPPGYPSSTFLARLVLAWAAARARHPLLASTIHTVVDCKYNLNVPGVVPREFRYEVLTPEEALLDARETFLLHETTEEPLSTGIDHVQGIFLNGERRLLAQDRCLARLVLVQSEDDPSKLGFFLAISHVISDGLSVFKLVNELFSLASSSALPSPASAPSFRTLNGFLGPHTPLETWDVPPPVHTAWETTVSGDDLLARLPLSNEEHYPPIPVPATQSSPPAAPTSIPPSRNSSPPTPSISHPSLARRRWFYAIHRVLGKIRFDRYPTTLHIPRARCPVPPPQAKNRWPQLRFEKETSRRLLAFCKKNGVSPSMLLYSLISLALSNIFSTLHPSKPYHPIILGFPFSFRPFLLPHLPPAPTASSAVQHSDPSSDLAIRITFSQIHLPNLALDPADPEQKEHIKAAALRGARLAKKQFAERLAPEPATRSRFMAEAYSLVMQRLLNGTGHNPIPFSEPKTALNASMIGDVDRLLPTSFPLPPFASPSPSSPSAPPRDESASPGSLRLSSLLIGTRLHNGEGMLLEAFTWDGMVTLCLGVDDEVVDPRMVEALFGGIRALGEVVAEGMGEE